MSGTAAVALEHGVVLEAQGWAPRLGRALWEARKARDASLRELARNSGGRFTARELRQFEKGMRPAGDLLSKLLAEVYDIELAQIAPPRTGLEVDLEARILRAGGATRRFDAQDDVVHSALAAYLDLVWAMRGTERTVVPLRRNDVHVLADVLDLDEERVVETLAELMRCSKADARRLLAVLQRRSLVAPASAALLVGMIIGLTAHHDSGSAVRPIGSDRAPILGSAHPAPLSSTEAIRPSAGPVLHTRLETTGADAGATPGTSVSEGSAVDGSQSNGDPASNGTSVTDGEAAGSGGSTETSGSADSGDSGVTGGSSGSGAPSGSGGDDGASGEEPSGEEPSGEEPSAEEPSAEEPSAEEPSAEEPSAEEPSADKPSAEAPSPVEPIAEEPSGGAEEPSAEAPSAEEPIAEEPIAEEPSAEGPSAEEPSAEAPSAEEPSAEEPSAEAPSAEEPSAEAPSAEEPIVEEPIAEEPIAEEPIAEEPSGGTEGSGSDHGKSELAPGHGGQGWGAGASGGGGKK